MGLLIYTAFDTKEGMPIQSVYAHITSLACDFRGYYTGLTITQETYLNRDKRVNGFAPLFAPTIEYRMSFQVPYNSMWGNMSYLYGKIKQRLIENGFTVEDVLEDPPAPPAPAPEPAPAEETPPS